jgi:hypothetical protein
LFYSCAARSEQAIPTMVRVKVPILLLSFLVAVGGPALSSAQEDTPSLGDVARTLRKSKSQQDPEQATQPAPDPSRVVIDNDNLSQAMEEVRNARPAVQSKPVFSVDASGALKLKAPDVMCSLSFNAGSSTTFVRPVLIEDLPLDELVKLDGPGSIQDESLQLEVFNGTEWELREITVGLTLERKPGENAELAARARVIPAAEGVMSASPAVTVERRADVTLLYRLKAEAKPFSRTAFNEKIGIAPGPDEDWRWSIVEAKGIRPAVVRAPESLSQPLFGDPLPFVPATNVPPPSGVPSVPSPLVVP